MHNILHILSSRNFCWSKQSTPIKKTQQFLKLTCHITNKPLLKLKRKHQYLVNQFFQKVPGHIKTSFLLFL